MADRRKVTEKQAADTIAAYQRGEQLPAGTIIDFTEPPYVFQSASVKADDKPADKSAETAKDGK